MNWYIYALIDDNFKKEAGWKENITTALLSAIIMVMSGSTIHNAVQKYNIDENELIRALQDEESIQKAKEFYEHKIQPIPPSSLPSIKDIKDILISHEGWKREVYLDTKGNPTIGVGFNLNKNDAPELLKSVGADYNKIISAQESLNDNQIMALLEQDIQTAIKDARNFVSNFDNLPTKAQLVLIDMSFNLGAKKLNQFQKMKQAIEIRDFDSAAKEMIDSAWYNQVGDRSKHLVEMMKSIE